MIIKLASTLDHAKRELDLIGMTANNKDEMNREMRKNILDIIKTFSKQGHSGCSAGYAIGILSKLLKHQPLSPLKGDDKEWNDVSETSGCKGKEKWYQNKRLSSVFKIIDKNGKVKITHDDAITFIDKDGISYQSRESSVPIKKFPYIPEYKTEKR